MAGKLKLAGIVSKVVAFITGFAENISAGKAIAQPEQIDQQPDTNVAGKRPAEGTDGLRLELGGEANAIGDDTHAAGSVSSKVVDTGKVTIASGSATFSASAQSSPDGTAYAAAYSYADVDGADIVLTRTRGATHTSQIDSQTYTAETSQTRVFAIDIEGFDLPRGPIVLGGTMWHGGSNRPQPIQGNVAGLTVEAEAHGDNTSVVVDATVLTVEDQFSGVSATAVTEVA
jgi:hypothetical protein